MKIGVAGGTGVVGRHVTELVRARGHEAVVISRSAGIDLMTGEGLAQALEGADGVIDVANAVTLSAKASRRFFGTTTSTLLSAEATAGVRHHVALSIVNAARVNAQYFAGKALQETTVKRSTVPWTILRSTQFHEFAAQNLKRGSLGVVAVVPLMRTQPVAAREVADRLVDLVLAPARGDAPDLAGPGEELLADMVRAYARATGSRVKVIQVALPGGMGAAMRSGGLLPSRGAELGAQSFQHWLDSDLRGSATG